MKFVEESSELSLSRIDEVGDIGFVEFFLSLDLFIGFLGLFKLTELAYCLPLICCLVLELEDIEISKALSLMRLKAPTSSAADLSEFEVA